MAALATPTRTHPPMHLDQLPNSYPVHMFEPGGVAHDIDDDGWHTRCGLRISHGKQITLVQVHVWLGHAFCYTCFTGSA